MRILPRNAIPNCDREERDRTKREEEEAAVKTAGTSSSNFQPNQLDNDKTSRTSPVVHRSSPPSPRRLFHLSLPLSASSPFGPLIHLVPGQSSPPSLVISGSSSGEGEREKKREKRQRVAIPRTFLTPRCSEISAASGMTKNYPGYPENILSYPFSSLSHVWSHRRRSSLLSRIHTHLLLPLSHPPLAPSSLLTFLPFSPPFSPFSLPSFSIRAHVISYSSDVSYPVFRPDARVSFEKSRGQVIEQGPSRENLRSSYPRSPCV